jgi:DNA-directed RNA polymerase specialized sigma24 family protein
MPATLTTESFARLLAWFDDDRERAGELYEDLRRRLIKFFEWRGAPFPEDHADETLNRVASKLAAGVEIKNLRGYCYEVARLVCLEAWKGNDRRREPLEATHYEVAAAPNDPEEGRELLLECLDDCLVRLPAESHALIVEYYQDHKGDQIERRKLLARTLGLRREALANRAQRLRDKLQQCVTRCVNRKTAIPIR